MEQAVVQDPPLVAQRKQELLNYVTSFYRASWNWRSQKKHEQWDKWDRNYHSQYDPTALSRKEPWQTKMFIGITVQNVEVICSQLFKTVAAPRPPIQVAAGPAGDDLQARLIQEVLDYQMRKASFDVNFYDALKEAVRYGSGFMKFFWERIEDVRPRKVPLEETPEELVSRLPAEALRGEVPIPTPGIKAFHTQMVKVLLRNNMSARYVHIRDIFPEPNTTDWKNVIHRDKIPYGTIVRYIKDGAWLDCRNDLENVSEGERFEQDLQVSRHDRSDFEQTRQLSKFEKKHTVWEMYAKIPRKWLQAHFDMEESDDAEELVPAKVMVASGRAVLCSEPNPFGDAESPIVKMDYIRTGETYGKGVIELIEDEQDEINELRNLRVDNINMTMNRMVAVLEQALVNPKDLVSKPGGVIRLKANVADDIRKAIYPFELPDVPGSALRETLEIERGVQERTGANRVTLGSSAEVRDTNQTLGGMEMLKQMFNERVAAIGMVMESTFLLKAAEKMYSLIYQELQPQDLQYILGDDPVEVGTTMDPLTLQPKPVEVPRFLAFAFPPPEVINTSYLLKPMGIFSMENKVLKTAQILDFMRLFGDDPRFDKIAAGKYVAKLQQIDEADKWFQPLPVLPGMPGIPGMAPEAPLMPPPGPPEPPEAPGMNGGPNGNQPRFLPPNPLRRQPRV